MDSACSNSVGLSRIRLGVDGLAASVVHLFCIHLVVLVSIGFLLDSFGLELIGTGRFGATVWRGLDFRVGVARFGSGRFGSTV